MVSAWLLASLIGCGSVKTNPATDAAAPTTDATNTANDGGVDAAGPDAQTNGTITVKVMIAGNPAEGIPVFSHDIDGSYIASALTNSSGEVTIDDFPAGGAVTAPVTPYLDHFDNSINRLTSITGVQIGDVLTLGNSVWLPNEVSIPTVGNASISPPANAVANATRYRVYIPCRTSSTATVGATISLALREGCIKPDNTIDAFAVAEDANGNRLAYSTRTGIQVSGVAPNRTASAALNGWNTDFASLRLNLQNAPFDNMGPAVLFRGHRDGLLLDDESSGLPLLVNMGDQGFFLRKSVPNFNNDSAYVVGMQLELSEFEEATIISTREQLSFNPGTTLVRNIDLTSDLLPVIENLAVTGGVANLAVNWTTAGNAMACKGSPMPDSLVTMVRGETANDDYMWFVLSPGASSQSIAFPKLDPALAQSIWPFSTFTEVTGGVAVFSDTARTWDEIRQAENSLNYFDFVPSPDSTRCISTGGTLTIN